MSHTKPPGGRDASNHNEVLQQIGKDQFFVSRDEVTPLHWS